MKNVVICGLPWSPNLGDGAIYEGLSSGLGECLPALKCHPLDLSGRTGFGANGSGVRNVALSVLPWMPQPVRHGVMRRAIGQRISRAKVEWERMIAGADAVVIGGGQLLADADLNFPLKLASVARVAARHGKPVALHAVGASAGWSAEGRRLFETLGETDLRAVRARDATSLRILSSIFPSVETLEIAADPGILAPRCWRTRRKTPVAGELHEARIGICITDPRVLVFHRTDEKVCNAPAADDWVNLVSDIAASGGHVTLFTNGAGEDQSYLGGLAGRNDLAALIEKRVVDIAPAPGQPSDLGKTIGSFDVVVAHRLHALILAHGTGIPAVGLRWDRKVSDYASMAGTSDLLFETLDPSRIRGGIVEALSRNDGARIMNTMAGRAEAGILRLVGSFPELGTCELSSLRECFS